jgi:hypothetical protein
MSQTKSQLSIPRYPLLAVALFASLVAMWAGLLRLGWKLLSLVPTLALTHGPLMVSGFMSTLINLECAGVPMTYRPVFYSYGALQHISLVGRIIGDLTGDVALR